MFNLIPFISGSRKDHIYFFIKNSENLGVKKSKEIVRHALELVIDRTNDGGDSTLHSPNRRSQRPRVVLRVLVQIRNAHQRLNRRDPHKP